LGKGENRKATNESDVSWTALQKCTLRDTGSGGDTDKPPTHKHHSSKKVSRERKKRPKSSPLTKDGGSGVELSLIDGCFSKQGPAVWGASKLGGKGKANAAGTLTQGVNQGMERGSWSCPWGYFEHGGRGRRGGWPKISPKNGSHRRT